MRAGLFSPFIERSDDIPVMSASGPKECVPLWTDCSTQCRIEFNIRVPLDLYASLQDIPGLDALS